MANYEFRKFLNMLGFVASMLIALASLIAIFVALAQGQAITLPGLEFKGLIDIIMAIANILAYFIVLVAGFNYARSKRSLWFIVAQTISTVVVFAVIIVANIL